MFFYFFIFLIIILFIKNKKNINRLIVDNIPVSYRKCYDLFCYHNYFTCPKYDGSYKQCTNNSKLLANNKITYNNNIGVQKGETDDVIYYDSYNPKTLSKYPRVNYFRTDSNDLLNGYVNKYILY